MEQLIIKYLTDTISTQELEQLRYLLAEEKNQEKFKAYVRANHKLDATYRNIDSEKAYQLILKDLQGRKTTKVHKLYINLAKYAAIFIIALSAGYFLYINTIEPHIEDSEFVNSPEVILDLGDGEQRVLDESVATHIIVGGDSTTVKQEYDKISYKGKDTLNEFISYHKLRVPYGKRFQIELSDGTLVFLNAGTSLSYPTSFRNTDKREITLDGEAYVQLTANESLPFIVHTQNMNVRVLGTKFNVSSYKNERNTSTVLVEGSVVVYRENEKFSDQSLRVIPGQQVILQKDEFELQQVNVQKHIAWTEGKLYFVNDRFDNIVREMERHFNVDIVNKYEELNNVHYTGTFINEGVEDILDIFKGNTEFSYRKEGGKIIIEPVN